MGDLIGFEGYMNASAPFHWEEYNFEWKSDRRYTDFTPGNDYNSSCEYPPMWGEDGWPLDSSITQNMEGCRASEFDSVRHLMLRPWYLANILAVRLN